LLRASLRLGAIYAGAGDDQYAALSRFGEHVGLAFQIVDDILDVEESSEALGKTAGKDAQTGQDHLSRGLWPRDRRAAWPKRNVRAPHQVLETVRRSAVVRLHEIADHIVRRKS